MYLAFLVLCLQISFGAMSQQDSENSASSFETSIGQAITNGDIQKAEEQANLFISFARQSQNEVSLARAFFESAKVDIERQNFQQAQEKLSDAIVLFERNEEEERLGHTFLLKSKTHFKLLEFVKSLEFNNKALDIFRLIGDPHFLSNTYNNLGTTLQNIGEFEEAIKIYEQSLEIVRDMNDEQGIATVLYNIGTLQSTLGNYKNALSYFNDVLTIDTKYSDMANMAFSYMNIADTLALMNNLPEARKNILRSIELFEQGQALESVEQARVIQADIELQSGNTSRAASIVDGVLKRVTNASPEVLLSAYMTSAKVSIKQSNYDRADEYLTKALSLATERQRKPIQIEIYALLVELYKAKSEYKQAVDAIEKQKQLEDEVKNTAAAIAGARMQVRSEFVRRESRLQLLEKEKSLNEAVTKRKQNEHFVMIGAIAAGLLFLILMVGRMVQAKTNKDLSKIVDRKTQELQIKNEELSKALRTIELESTTDPLTGLHNRRYITKSIGSDLTFSRRGYESWFNDYQKMPTNSDLIVFMIDIDNFKKLNDTHGHHSGDIVLVEFAKRIAEVFRLSDYLVRWGGEEFLAIARFVNRDAAPNLADRLLEKINSEPFYINQDLTKQVTCSVGYSCYPVSLEIDMKTSWEKLISLADAGLYLAKNSGKNTWYGVHSVKSTAYLGTELTKEELKEMMLSGKIELRSPSSGNNISL